MSDLSPGESPDTVAPPGLSLGAVVGVCSAESPTALEDDLAIARGISLDHVRLTVPWVLAQPKPGTLDGGVVEMVRGTAQAVRAAGGKCRCHPQVLCWFDNDGGFSDEATARHWWPRLG